MVITSKTKTSPFGFEIFFQSAPIKTCQVEVTRPELENPYKRNAIITLPCESPGDWLHAVCGAFRRMQHGDGWNLMLDYKNVTQFFEMDDMKVIEELNPSYPILIYGAPHKPAKKCSKINVNALYRRVERMNRRQREAASNAAVQTA